MSRAGPSDQISDRREHQRNKSHVKRLFRAYNPSNQGPRRDRPKPRVPKAELNADLHAKQEYLDQLAGIFLIETDYGATVRDALRTQYNIHVDKINRAFGDSKKRQKIVRDAVGVKQEILDKAYYERQLGLIFPNLQSDPLYNEYFQRISSISRNNAARQKELDEARDWPAWKPYMDELARLFPNDYPNYSLFLPRIHRAIGNKTSRDRTLRAAQDIHDQKPYLETLESLLARDPRALQYFQGQIRDAFGNNRRREAIVATVQARAFDEIFDWRGYSEVT